jgi:hypothetical protein
MTISEKTPNAIICAMPVYAARRMLSKVPSLAAWLTFCPEAEEFWGRYQAERYPTGSVLLPAHSHPCRMAGIFRPCREAQA